MGKRWWGSGILFFCAAALIWCWRDTLLDTVLAARAHLVLSSLLLLLLYMLKGLTAAVPLSALEAVGGMLFPPPVLWPSTPPEWPWPRRAPIGWGGCGKRILRH